MLNQKENAGEENIVFYITSCILIQTNRNAHKYNS